MTPTFPTKGKQYYLDHPKLRGKSPRHAPATPFATSRPDQFRLKNSRTLKHSGALLIVLVGVLRVLPICHQH